MVPASRATLSRESVQIVGHYCGLTWCHPSWRECRDSGALLNAHVDCFIRTSAELAKLQYPHVGDAMCTCREGAELAKYVCAHKRLPTQRKGGASRALERQACRAAPPRPALTTDKARGHTKCALRSSSTPGSSTWIRGAKKHLHTRLS